jgi:hypothetical protein
MQLLPCAKNSAPLHGFPFIQRQYNNTVAINTVGHTLYDCYVSLIRTKGKALGQFSIARMRVCVPLTPLTFASLARYIDC